MSPRVSILTTSYNRAGYLAAAIESVLAQTQSDFEYIIVDDRSPDHSLEIARRYESDPRVRVVENERNLGDYGNRNKAVSLARGEYVKFVDCDDFLYPHCVESMLEVAGTFPEAAVIFSTKERRPWEYPVQLSPEEAYRIQFAGGGILHQGPLSALLRRDALLAAGGFPEIYTGDVACWLNLAREYPVVLMKGGLFWWREHAGQLSDSLRSVTVKWAEHQAEGLSLERGALLHERCPLPAAERKTNLLRLERQYARMALGQLIRGRGKVFRHLKRGAAFNLLKAARRQPAAEGRPENPVRASCDAHSAAGQPTLTYVGSPVNDAGVSILLPASGHPEEAADTVRSILAQTFENWELVLDARLSAAGSETATLLKAVHPDRVKLIAGGAGVAGTCNALAQEARGTFLKCLLPGDILAPEALSHFVWFGEKHPEADLIISTSDERFPLPCTLEPADLYRSEVLRMFSVLGYGGAAMCRRGAWRDAGGWSADAAGAEDVLHLRIAQTGAVTFFYGGMIERSSRLREGCARTCGLTDENRKVLCEALQSKTCPLDRIERDAAMKLVLKKTGAASRRLFRAIRPLRRLAEKLMPSRPVGLQLPKALEAAAERAFTATDYPPPSHQRNQCAPAPAGLCHE